MRRRRRRWSNRHDTRRWWRCRRRRWHGWRRSSQFGAPNRDAAMHGHGARVRLDIGRENEARFADGV